MDYLTQQNRRCEGDTVAAESSSRPKGKHVVIIGGGDTGADCLGTVHRQGALSVSQFELMPRPPEARAADNPWPLWPTIFRTSVGARRRRRAAVFGLDRTVHRRRAGPGRGAPGGAGRDGAGRAGACGSWRVPTAASR